MIGLTAGLVIEGQTGNSILSQVPAVFMLTCLRLCDHNISLVIAYLFNPLPDCCPYSWLDTGKPLSIFLSDRYYLFGH